MIRLLLVDDIPDLFRDMRGHKFRQAIFVDIIGVTVFFGVFNGLYNRVSALVKDGIIDRVHLFFRHGSHLLSDNDLCQGFNKPVLYVRIRRLDRVRYGLFHIADLRGGDGYVNIALVNFFDLLGYPL